MNFDTSPLESADPPTTDTRHILDFILARATANTAPSPLSPSEFKRAVIHLATCPSCRAGLTALALALSRPDLEALAAHSLPDATPDEVELANYVALRIARGVAIARKHFPDVDAHVASCIYCQEATNAIGASLGYVAPSVAPEAAWVNTSEPGIWQGDGIIRRLLEPYILWVRPFFVRITSALADPQIFTEPTPASNIRDGQSGDMEELEQSFSLDLHNDHTHPIPWIRVKVHLRTLPSGQVSGELAASQVGNVSDQAEPVVGVAWSITGAAEVRQTFKREGQTNGKGLSYFSLPRPAEYLLTFDAVGLHWVVPLTVRIESLDTPSE